MQKHDLPRKGYKLSGTVVPRSYATPVKLFSQQHYFELGPENLELSYFPLSYAIFSPLLRYFSPQLRFFLLFPPQLH